MTKYVNICNKEYYQYGVGCLLKFLTNTKSIRYIRITTRSYMHISYYIPQKLLLSRINKEGDIFPKKIETRISFIRLYRYMSFDQYLNQQLPMCETKLTQMLYKRPTPINSLNRDLPHPLIYHYNHIPNQDPRYII